MGDIEEIVNQLDILQENQPALGPFAQHARQLAQGYQVEKLESFIKEFVE